MVRRIAVVGMWLVLASACRSARPAVPVGPAQPTAAEVLFLELPAIGIAQRGPPCLFDLDSTAIVYRRGGEIQPAEAHWCTLEFPASDLPEGWFSIVGRLVIALPDGRLALRVSSFESAVDLAQRGGQARVVVWSGEIDPGFSSGAFASATAEVVGGGQVRFESDRLLRSELVLKITVRADN